MTRTCSIEGCNGIHRAKGWCNKHYQRWVRHGDPLGERQILTGCKVDGCEGKHYGAGYCNKHYTRVRKYGDPLIVHVKKPTQTVCSVNNCQKKFYAKGMCRMHYARVAKHGSTELPERTKAADRPCAFEGCVNNAKVSTLCSAHYNQKYRGEELRPLGTYTKSAYDGPITIDAKGRTCAWCGQYKTYDNFYEKKKGSGQYRSHCKRCIIDDSLRRYKQK